MTGSEKNFTENEAILILLPVKKRAGTATLKEKRVAVVSKITLIRPTPEIAVYQLSTWFMKRILYCSILIFSALHLHAQDPIFSQFYAAPLQINPAFAGNTLAPRISLNYRSQWPSLNNAYVTYAASYEQLFEPLNSGIGLMVQSDNAGDGIFKTTRFGATYAYRLTISEDFFAKFGTEIGGSQVNLDWNKLVFTDQIDPITGPVDENGVPFVSDEIRPDDLNKAYLDISAGFLFYNPYFYVGLSAKHLNTPDETILGVNQQLNSGLPVRWIVHGGAEITLVEGNRQQWPVFIAPSAAFIKQSDFGQIDAGAYIGFGVFFAGSWYRHAFTNPDAVIFSAGYSQDILKIGYSYDWTVSDLANAPSGGAHEISLTLNFENSEMFKNRRKASRYNDCFKLFR